MTATPGPVGAAEARHRIANLLHTYTGISDRKDVPAVLDILGDTVVTFPADGYTDRAGAAAFFGRLWAGDVRHRHDVSNLVVTAGEDGAWTATAHYTRYVFEPDPVLATLGEYALTAREVDGAWAITHLTVTRTWSR